MSKQTTKELLQLLITKVDDLAKEVEFIKSKTLDYVNVPYMRLDEYTPPVHWEPYQHTVWCGDSLAPNNGRREDPTC